ncbi:MAG TPA: TSUP family transporter, partial [Albitalea sp.]|nr:TSUP family transporter [Albitalea sp.]
GGPSTAVDAALGGALCAYAGLGLLSVRWCVAPRHERWLSPLVGLSTGLVTAATGVFVIPAVPYLQALGLEKEELVQALGVAFLVSTLALAASLNHGGALQPAALGASLLALLPALAGMGLGQWLRGRVAAALFRQLFLLSLLLLGAYLVLRALLF